MTKNGLRFPASDGKLIAYQKVSSSTAAKAVVVIGHGMNDYGGRFLELAKTLASIGMVAYLPDLRGHGDTDDGANRGYLADSNGFERVVDDLVEFGDFAAKEQGGLPLYYFGHSFGALLGMALCGMYGKYLDGVVLSAPPEKPAPVLDALGGLVVKLGKAVKGAHAPAKLPRSMTFGSYAKTVPNRKTGSDWISRDDAVVAAYVADPKCNFTCSYGFYDDLMYGLKKVYSEGFLDSVPTNLSLYLFSGSKDPVIGMKAGFDLMSRSFRDLGLVDFESKCYEGGRHESINELNKAEVLSDIADWFSRHIA
ncbi:MAG TPA: alpha/beta hydrolase [Rectinemataceae bacterium]|nr:alpha/beta hydrolase [Rectinemataceae bacterium]